MSWLDRARQGNGDADGGRFGGRVAALVIVALIALQLTLAACRMAPAPLEPAETNKAVAFAGSVQFGAMIACQNCPFNQINGHGCYCGLGGGGQPQDQLDNCCVTHDACWANAARNNAGCNCLNVGPWPFGGRGSLWQCRTINNGAHQVVAPPAVGWPAGTDACTQACTVCNANAANCFNLAINGTPTMSAANYGASCNFPRANYPRLACPGGRNQPAQRVPRQFGRRLQTYDVCPADAQVASISNGGTTSTARSGAAEAAAFAEARERGTVTAEAGSDGGAPCANPMTVETCVPCDLSDPTCNQELCDTSYQTCADAPECPSLIFYACVPTSDPTAPGDPACPSDPSTPCSCSTCTAFDGDGNCLPDESCTPDATGLCPQLPLAGNAANPTI